MTAGANGDDKTSPVVPSAWQILRRYTQARIALGRAGTSLPTKAHLEFQFDHARARDAVHRALDTGTLQAWLEEHGLHTVVVRSAAETRGIYLQRPDLGRRLDEGSRKRLAERAAAEKTGFDVAIVVVDGLSALAIETNAVPFLAAVLPALRAENVRLTPAVIVEQGRVAVGDEIGQTLAAALVVVLIGERPGLSSPDSLGVYMTWDPTVGRTDADRNCISNIRPDGLSYAAGAHKLLYLIRETRRRRLSGVKLKDETQMDGVALAADEAGALEESRTGGGTS